ncbi:putative NAD/FAD-binding protein [Actinocorallia herbida]|uniref:Putative NAD/FAD-binding protein n=1 Tax=Actinocorallia herbida TaxID=58109 RepID=A0A3N1CSN8_9ACTN|nr:FAD-dependent oxidoreductase [Actinocorallia herbida]ROO84336.1 putative NAD/FAD-binding protein [Actinocorallia herbida]
MALSGFAVIGSGVSGLTAAHLLARRGTTTLYEADSRLGGHAHTHDLPAGDGRADGPTVPVDSGFIVHNDRTYPLLTGLFRELGVATRDTEMSMSVSCAGCGLEYAGARGLRGLLAGRPTRPYLGMLRQVPRFHRAARALLSGGDVFGGRLREDDPTVGEFLRAGAFTRYFTAHFAKPLVAAVWSCPPGTAMDYPARHLFAFLDNHGMLSVNGSPQWKTVVGGSRVYVERIAAGLPEVLRDTPVRAVVRHADGVDVYDASGTTRSYAAAVIATHADQALAVLPDPSADEKRVLGAFTYSRNPTVLHSDTSVLPRASAARASWNYAMDLCAADVDRVRVSYDMNRLQGLPTAERYLVTLNGAVPARHVHARMVYAHPVFTRESVAAQKELPGLSDGRLAFAGAHHGWGFHEDGCRSGFAAARALGAIP